MGYHWDNWGVHVIQSHRRSYESAEQCQGSPPCPTVWTNRMALGHI